MSKDNKTTTKKTATAKKSVAPKSATTKKTATKNKTATTKAPKKSERELKQDRARVELGTNRPVEYYYVVGKSKTNFIEYVDVQQVLNDKFNGKITQSVYFPVAEQSKRIFTLNKLLFEKVCDDCLKYDKLKFLVQVSAKWLSTLRDTNTLMAYLELFGENVILAFDSVTLIRQGDKAKTFIKKLQKDYHFKILFDNCEFQNLSQLIGWHVDYVRFDARFVDKADESYTQVVKFMRDYLKAQGVKMVVRNIKDDAIRYYFINNGADVVEGNGVYTPKKLINSILKDFKLKDN